MPDELSQAVSITDKEPVKKIQTGFTVWPLLLDVSLRYLAYFFWREGHLGSTLFWIIQLFAMTLLSGRLMGSRTNSLVKYFGVADNKGFEIKDKPGWIIFMLIIIVNNIFHAMNDVHIEHWWMRIPIEIVLSILILMFTIAIGVSSSTKERLDIDSFMYEAFEANDENDRMLTRLQAELADIIRKVEAYTIESTLIGAISFAAYVTIVSADKGGFDVAHGLLDSATTISPNLLFLHEAAIWRMMHYPQERTILVAVALSALLCSLFFMGVIVARLRFNSLLGRGSFSVDMAALLNRKEDLLTADRITPERHAWLSKHIEEYLNETHLVLDQLRPVVSYMTVFRTLGLFAFMLTLILSALWFGPRTAAAFAIVALLTCCYPFLDALRDKKLQTTDFSKLSIFLTNKFLIKH